MGLVCMRVMEIVTLCLIGFFIPYISPLRESLIPLVIIAYTFARAHEVAYGSADTTGIRFKRYLRWHFVRWQDIQSVTKNSKISMTVVLERKNFLNRKIVFIENPAVRDLLRDSNTFQMLQETWIENRQAQ